MPVPRILAALVCIAGLGSSTIAAPQRQVEHGGDVAADVRVEISNIAGSVRVVGGADNRISVRGTLGDGIDRLSFENDHDDVEIAVEPLRRRRTEPGHEVGDTHLEISVPRGATLEIETLAASIVVDDVDGDVRMESSAGSITYAGGSRRIEAGAASGDIEIATTAARSDVDVEGVAGHVLVQLAAGTVRASTLTGDLRVIGGRISEGNFESVSGMLYFEGEIDDNGDLRFENFNGDIELLVPEDSSAVFDIGTYSGEIDTEFGYQGRPADMYSPEQRAAFTLGSGGARINIDTFAGNVAVRRR